MCSPMPLASVTVCLSVPAQLFAWQTESSARTLCSWTFPSQDGITDMDHVAVMVRLKNTDFKCVPLRFSTHACTRTETQMHSFIHTCTHSLILSVATRKLPCWGLQKFIHFSSTRFGRARLLMKSLAELYTVTSSWVVNLQSSNHSHLPLVNRIKCSVGI